MKHEWGLFDHLHDIVGRPKPRKLPAGTLVGDNAKTAVYEVQGDGSYKRITPKGSKKRMANLVKKKLKEERRTQERKNRKVHASDLRKMRRHDRSKRMDARIPKIFVGREGSVDSTPKSEPQV